MVDEEAERRASGPNWTAHVGRIRFQRNPVLIGAFMSAVTDEDRWGNRWMAKERSLNKIDPAVALCMALGAAAGGTGPPLIDVMAMIA